MAVRVSGTEGYADDAAALILRYESLSPAEVHASVRNLIPGRPCNVLDIGSGSGRDAAWFAAMGHRVVAAEPVGELRVAAMALHPHDGIAWCDDSLPDLPMLMRRGETFDVVMLTAVWMHLDEDQRRQAMPNLARLMRVGGVMIMAIRHGPVPPPRRMFEIPAEETIRLARMQGLDLVLNRPAPSLQHRNQLADVTWTRLAFVKPVGSRPDVHTS